MLHSHQSISLVSSRVPPPMSDNAVVRLSYVALFPTRRRNVCISCYL
jgi:hypothetical protein